MKRITLLFAAFFLAVVFLLMGAGKVRLKAATTYSHFTSLNFTSTYQTVRFNPVIAVHPVNPSVIYLGTSGGGILKSADGGRTWEHKNNGLPSRFIEDIAFDPKDPNILYAGIDGHISSNGGGVYKSVDGGEYWNPLPGTIAGGTPFNVNPCGSAGEIQIDPTNSNRLYFGVTVNACDVRGKLCGGFYRSSDGGAAFGPNPGCTTLRPYKDPLSFWPNDAGIVRINPLRPNELYVSPQSHPEEQALAASFDYGETIHFTDVVDGRNATFVPAEERGILSLLPHRFVLSPVNPDVRYAIYGTNDGKTPKESNNVAVPRPVYAPQPGAVPQTPVMPTLVRWSGEKGQSTVDGAGDNDLDNEASADNIWRPIFYLNSLPQLTNSIGDIVKTTYQVDALAADIRDLNKVYVATHARIAQPGGITSWDRANIWEFTPDVDPTLPWKYRGIYEGMRPITSPVPFVPYIETIATDPSSPYRIYFSEVDWKAGTNLNPLHLKVLESNDNGVSWSVRTVSNHFFNLHATEIKEFELPDGGKKTFLASTLGLFRLVQSPSQEYWAHYDPSQFQLQGSTFSTIVQSPRNKNIFYTKAPRYVAVSADGGGFFGWMDEIRFGLGTHLSCPYNFPDPVLTTAVFNALAVDPSADNVLYAGSDGGLWRNKRTMTATGTCGTSDVTQAWERLAPTGLDNTYIWSLAFDPADPTGNTMWTGTRNGLYKSVTHGSTWTKALPGVRDVTQIGFQGNVILAATLDGLYRSEDGGLQWTQVIALPVNRVSNRRGFENEWAAATSEGISLSSDGGKTWQPTEIAMRGPVDAVLYTTAPQGAKRLYYSGSGSAIYRTEIVEDDVTPPTAPIILGARQGPLSQIDTSWQTSTDNGVVAGYKIFRSTTSGGPYTLLATTAGTTYSDTAFAPYTTYYYAIQAYDSAGNTSQNSPEWGITTGGSGLWVKLSASPQRGSSPLTVMLGAFIAGTLGVPSNITFYCNRADAGTNVTTPYALRIENTTSALILRGGLCVYKYGGNYFPKIVVERSSIPSGEAKAFVIVSGPPEPDTLSPAAPENLSATALSSSQINLSWRTSTDNVKVTGYNILRSPTTGGPYTTIGTSVATSFADTDLTASTALYYVVQAYDATGNVSQNSAEVSATTSGISFCTSSECRSDTIPPVVSITSPLPQSAVSGPLTLSATASDNVGVAGVQFLLDGGRLGEEDLSHPFSVLWETAGTTNGFHILGAVARDATGNTGTAAPVQVTVANRPDTASSTFTLSQDLRFGASHPDVKTLQLLLQALGFFPRGEISTGFFGKLTREAVIEYQKSKGIEPAAGFVGPLTRARLAGETALPPVSPFGRPLVRGLSGDDVLRLQEKLQRLGFFPKIQTPTGYFGTVTEKAVRDFQCAKGIVCGGDPATSGYGTIGPRTRKTLDAAP